MINTDFMKGVVVPILTPIDEDEKIDEKKLRKQVDYVIEGACWGFWHLAATANFTW